MSEIIVLHTIIQITFVQYILMATKMDNRLEEQFFIKKSLVKKIKKVHLAIT